eukprot:SAG25_NODE_1559_length_2764_cov_2.636023_1_plen_26_part_10
MMAGGETLPWLPVSVHSADGWAGARE